MANGTIVNWQSSPYTFKVQNKNYLAEAAISKMQKLKECHFYGYTADTVDEYELNAFAHKYSDTSIGTNAILDNQVRIPCQKQNNNYLKQGREDFCLQNIANDYGNPYSDKRVGVFGTIRIDAEVFNITDKKLRFVPHFTTLKNYYTNNLSNAGYIWKFKEVFKNSLEGGGLYPERITTDSEYFNDENNLVCSSIDVYYYSQSDNKYIKPDYATITNNSNYRYDICFPIQYNHSFEFISKWVVSKNIIFVPLLEMLVPFSHNNLGITKDIFLGQIPGVDFVGITNMSGDYVPSHGVYGGNSAFDSKSVLFSKDPGNSTINGGKPCRMIVANKKTFEKLFNSVGIPWSYDPKKIADPDGDINYPTYPGQPNNPTGGGGGTGDNISDEIPMPSPSFLPNNTAYNRYWLKGSDISNLQSFLFSDTFLNDVKRLWTDPAEYMIKLAYYPFDGVAHDYNGTTNATVSIGGIASQISGFAMLDNYNNKFLGGTLDITEYYGTYLDYSPYTTAEIYIPYIGYRQINLSDVMGRTLEIQYAVDFDTGIITAFVLSDNTPLTMYSAPFGVEVALSGSNANQVAQSVLGMVGNVVSAAGGVVSLITSAGASAPVAIPQITGAAGNLVNQVMNLDISPRNFGSPSPTTALYAPQQPFIVLHRPITAEPADFAALNGYAAGYSGRVSGFTGYLKASSVKLSNDNKVSQAEQQEIISLLLGGVYIG